MGSTIETWPGSLICSLMDLAATEKASIKTVNGRVLDSRVDRFTVTHYEP